MKGAIEELAQEIRMLPGEDKAKLLRSLIGELDGAADSNVERAWLETSQRRHRELVEGKVKGIPGPLVFDLLRDRFARRGS